MASGPYSPLNKARREIRILRIQPASSTTEPIQCSLIQLAFADAPEYFALSYFWGSQDEKFDIILEGFPFQVERNLFEALRCLRRETETLVIWVDALCINQQDVGERNAQVQLMGDIYRGAVTV
jgi:hypothetical protein